MSVNSRDVLAQLSRSTDVPCTRAPAEHLCHACQLGHHVRLPFSSSHATHAFDLIHYDLWTSPVPSISGYKYYLVVVDDFSHYSWTFPLRASLRPFPSSSTSLHGCPLSSASPLRLSSVTTGVCSITTPPALSSSLGVYSCACLVRIPLHRTARLSGCCAPRMMSYALF